MGVELHFCVLDCHIGALVCSQPARVLPTNALDHRRLRRKFRLPIESRTRERVDGLTETFPLVQRPHLSTPLTRLRSNGAASRRGLGLAIGLKATKLVDSHRLIARWCSETEEAGPFDDTKWWTGTECWRCREAASISSHNTGTCAAQSVRVARLSQKGGCLR